MNVVGKKNSMEFFRNQRRKKIWENVFNSFFVPSIYCIFQIELKKEIENMRERWNQINNSIF